MTRDKPSRQYRPRGVFRDWGVAGANATGPKIPDARGRRLRSGRSVSPVSSSLTCASDSRSEAERYLRDVLRRRMGGTGGERESGERQDEDAGHDAMVPLGAQLPVRVWDDSSMDRRAKRVRG